MDNKKNIYQHLIPRRPLCAAALGAVLVILTGTRFIPIKTEYIEFPDQKQIEITGEVSAITYRKNAYSAPESGIDVIVDVEAEESDICPDSKLVRCYLSEEVTEPYIGQRIVNCLRLLSILITWTLESFGTSSASMKSRGYALKGRTAFSIYRFDHRDRTVVIFLFVCLTLTAMAVMLDQTYILYDPEIIFNRITWISYIFYAAYAAMLLLPLGLELYGAQRLRSSLAGAYR